MMVSFISCSKCMGEARKKYSGDFIGGGDGIW
jgi:hypothetical protein